MICLKYDAYISRDLARTCRNGVTEFCRWGAIAETVNFLSLDFNTKDQGHGSFKMFDGAMSRIDVQCELKITFL